MVFLTTNLMKVFNRIIHKPLELTFSFVSEKRTLTFRTARFGTMALIQDTHINMPLQSWEIRSRAVNHCVMTIIAAIIEVEIQIKVKEVAFTPHC
jgi:hypothetical protein